MTAMEAAPQLKASGLDGDYRILADFGGTVLAGTPSKYGVQFVTWDWDYDRTGVVHGHYFMENYDAAKQDFATRSGLIQKEQLFSPEQLTEIFRQAQKSDIVMNAHAVNEGHMPTPSGADGDFFFMKRGDAASVIETVAQLCSQRLPAHYGFSPSQIQVLSPARRQGSGTAALNRRLQEALNPPSENRREKRFGDIIFREGDRVMQVRNNYDIVWEREGGDETGTGVFNGDVGELERIYPQQECLIVRFDDRLATYTFDMLNELELAYAVTVHKSQGSEFDAVVFALSDGLPRRLLTRNILYTGITRAKQLLVIVGSTETVSHMVANNQKGRRYSALKARLRGADNADNSGKIFHRMNDKMDDSPI